MLTLYLMHADTAGEALPDPKGSTRARIYPIVSLLTRTPSLAGLSPRPPGQADRRHGDISLRYGVNYVPWSLGRGVVVMVSSKFLSILKKVTVRLSD